jgi:hypothetical protein
MVLRLFAVVIVILAVAFFLELVVGVQLGLVHFLRHGAAGFAGSISPW